jgi:hypothetical protein
MPILAPKALGRAPEHLGEDLHAALERVLKQVRLVETGLDPAHVYLATDSTSLGRFAFKAIQTRRWPPGARQSQAVDGICSPVFPP